MFVKYAEPVASSSYRPKRVACALSLHTATQLFLHKRAVAAAAAAQRPGWKEVQERTRSLCSYPAVQLTSYFGHVPLVLTLPSSRHAFAPAGNGSQNLGFGACRGVQNARALRRSPPTGLQGSNSTQLVLNSYPPFPHHPALPFPLDSPAHRLVRAAERGVRGADATVVVLVERQLRYAACEQHRVGRMSGSFPPGMAHRLLLSAPTAAIE